MGKVIVYLLSTLYGTLPNIDMYGDILLNKTYLSSLVADAIIILWQLRALISLSNLLLLKIPYVRCFYKMQTKNLCTLQTSINWSTNYACLYSCAVLPKFRYWTWNLHEIYLKRNQNDNPVFPCIKTIAFLI